MTPSLLVAMGQAIIDLAPPAAEDAAIDLFGTADKPALVMLMVAVVALLGAAVARATAESLPRAAATYVGGAVILTWPAVTRTSGSVSAVLLAGAATVVAGVLTQRLLLAPPERDEAGGDEAGGDKSTTEGAGQGDPGPDGATSRRGALRLAGKVAVGATLVGGAGRFLVRFSDPGIPDVTLPAPVGGGGLSEPMSATTFSAIEGLSPLYTPNDEFFRIDTALVLPRVDLDDWRLRVTGLVDEPFELTYDELLAMPQTEMDITLACVSNEVGGNLVGTARWQGVPLADLLDRAGVQPEGTQVVGRSVDGFTAGFPTGVGTDGRPAIVAVGMNGEPLPLSHGFPARLVVAGLYGYVSATKWLSEIEVATLEGFDGYWVPRGWNKLGPVEIQSRIDVPDYGQVLAPGPVTVAGVAWAPPTGVGVVEVQVDEGRWEPAELSEEVAPSMWRQWRYHWDAPEGSHDLRVRAANRDGVMQDPEGSRPRPGGATGIHRVLVRVR